MENTNLVFDGLVTTLKDLFTATKTNYENLHEHLNLKSKTKLTRLLNNPEEEADIEIVRDISRLTKVESVLIVNRLKVGFKRITQEEMSQLGEEDLKAQRKDLEEKERA